MDGSKMLKEIREQPEVLGRVLDEGWREVSAAARELRSRGFRSVMLAARAPRITPLSMPSTFSR